MKQRFKLLVSGMGGGEYVCAGCEATIIMVEQADQTGGTFEMAHSEVGGKPCRYSPREPVT